MDHRLAQFTLKSLKSPIEIKLTNGKVATGVLHAFDPETFNIIVKNYSDEKEKTELKMVSFGDVSNITVLGTN